MKKRLTIALVAHDNRKADMVEWVKHNAELLSHHHLVCTGTTGRLIKGGIRRIEYSGRCDLYEFGSVGGRCRNCRIGGSSSSRFGYLFDR